MPKQKTVLITGGAGYIGSHMVRAMMEAGYHVVVFDNLTSGHRRLIPKGIQWVKGDLNKPADLARLFKRFRFEGVFHFAASSIVSESMRDPMKYYLNNVGGFLQLLQQMLKHKVHCLIFSSTSAVYGLPKRIPIRETDPTAPMNPYGKSKLMMEEIIQDLARTSKLRYMILRYFNACGAHASGEIGEIREHETHLIPLILRVMSGQVSQLTVYGDDYNTLDGTCVRDYVHVEDLCRAHLLGLRYLKRGGRSQIVNLGSGRGHSVKEVIQAAERVGDCNVRYRVASRRAGDPDQLVASNNLARKLLGWKSQYSLDEMIQSAWNWQNHLVNK